MRGADITQESLFTVAKLDDFVPATHPLRAIRKLADTALQRMSALFDTLYADTGRASLRLQQQAWRGAELLAEGDIRIGCVGRDGPADFRPCRIPASILEKLR